MHVCCIFHYTILDFGFVSDIESNLLKHKDQD